MKSLLKQVNGLDYFIRQLRKMESKMNAGQFIQAWRECQRVTAELEKNKQELLKDADATPSTDEQSEMELDNAE